MRDVALILGKVIVVIVVVLSFSVVIVQGLHWLTDPDTKGAIKLADSYADDLHTGHKIAVRYSVAVIEKQDVMSLYWETNSWVEEVRKKLRADFGPAVEELWALGKNHYPLIGESARHDHDARVWKLADLIGEMRAGRLVKR